MVEIRIGFRMIQEQESVFPSKFSTLGDFLRPYVTRSETILIWRISPPSSFPRHKVHTNRRVSLLIDLTAMVSPKLPLDDAKYSVLFSGGAYTE